ncbi:MAG TPA: metal-dependent phosphohydrolase [Rhodocyclaceae bacterium]|nr:metal-dependent phosphohydrolase [Rhodocyclaceae bacterium]
MSVPPPPAPPPQTGEGSFERRPRDVHAKAHRSRDRYRLRAPRRAGSADPSSSRNAAVSAQDSPEYRFLQEIAADLSSGDVSFPTFLDATLKVRMALKSPDVTAEELSRIVMSEPLLSVKVIRLANSAALNPAGKPVADLRNAVIRVGFSSIRALAITVAMGQLLEAREMAPYAPRARALWEHSIEVAALSFVIAARLTRINAHEAMFTGLVHDIGMFYLLSRASKHPELSADSVELGRLLFEWHTSVGHAVLSTLGMSDEVTEAVSEHEMPMREAAPRTLAQVVSLANEIASHRNPFADDEVREAVRGAIEPLPRLAHEQLAEIVAESREEMDSIVAALSA